MIAMYGQPMAVRSACFGAAKLMIHRFCRARIANYPARFVCDRTRVQAVRGDFGIPLVVSHILCLRLRVGIELAAEA